MSEADRNSWRWSGLVVVLLLAYVLSPGPLSAIFGNNQPPPPIDKAFEIFYAPLAWLYQRSDSVHEAYDRYFKLWGQKR